MTERRNALIVFDILLVLIFITFFLGNMELSQKVNDNYDQLHTTKTITITNTVTINNTVSDNTPLFLISSSMVGGYPNVTFTYITNKYCDLIVYQNNTKLLTIYNQYIYQFSILRNTTASLVNIKLFFVYVFNHNQNLTVNYQYRNSAP